VDILRSPEPDELIPSGHTPDAAMKSGSASYLPSLWLKNHLALGTENFIKTDSPDLGGRDLISTMRTGGLEGVNYFFPD
jgi:hypothetical protein